MEKMTNTELAILGLVAEEPKHAYRLEQEIAQRGMREWTEIGFSSIYYVLNKLEGSGWLKSELRAEGSGPARRVYHLTETGWLAFRSEVESRLGKPRPRSGDFFLALANLPALAPEAVLRGLRTYQDGLRQKIQTVKEKQALDQLASQASGGQLPEHVDSLFDYAITTMAAELEWVNGLLHKYLQGRDGQDGEN